VRSAAAVRANIVRRLHPRAGKFDPTSGIGHTVAILGEAGKPLHITHILDRIEARTGKRPKITSLIGSIAQHARDGKIFYREQPGT
jgi:hypothetical protein